MGWIGQLLRKGNTTVTTMYKPCNILHHLLNGILGLSHAYLVILIGLHFLIISAFEAVTPLEENPGMEGSVEGVWRKGVWRNGVWRKGVEVGNVEEGSVEVMVPMCEMGRCA